MNRIQLFVVYLITTITNCEAKNITVNFVITTDKSEVIQFQSEKYIKEQITILNRYFLDENNHKIFNFSLGELIHYKNFKKRKCDFKTILNQPKEFIVKDLSPSFNRCFSQTESNDIFVFIYDSYAKHNQFLDTTSWGFHNKGKPFILLDWKRFNLGEKSAILHEMGHAMGLNHVCAPGTTRQDSTNRMASGQCGTGSMGRRNLGFNLEQVNKMTKNHAQMVK